MARSKKRWMYSPPKAAKPKVPEYLKELVEEKSNELVETVLKPEHIKPPSKENSFSYVVDIWTKWYRGYFYFNAKYRCRAENCMSEFFETKFARMEYVGDESFNLSYMRHTEKWWEIYQNLTLDVCLQSIKEEPHFKP